MWLAGLLWNGSSYNRDSLAFVHTTEVSYRRGLRNTLDRDSLSGYKFFGGSGGCLYGCRPLESYVPKHLPPKHLRP